MFGCSAGRRKTLRKRIYRKRVIGTLEEYSDVDAARRAVTGLICKNQLGQSRERVETR